MRQPFRNLFKLLHFYLIKLPFIYITVPAGFLFEFFITCPFIVMTFIDARRQDRIRSKPRN